MSKVKVPITERIVSNLMKEYPNLTGVIDKISTTFYDENDVAIFTMVKTTINGKAFVSYHGHFEEYKQGE